MWGNKTGIAEDDMMALSKFSSEVKLLFLNLTNWALLASVAPKITSRFTECVSSYFSKNFLNGDVSKIPLLLNKPFVSGKKKLWVFQTSEALIFIQTSFKYSAYSFSWPGSKKAQEAQFREPTETPSQT